MSVHSSSGDSPDRDPTSSSPSGPESASSASLPEATPASASEASPPQDDPAQAESPLQADPAPAESPAHAESPAVAPADSDVTASQTPAEPTPAELTTAEPTTVADAPLVALPDNGRLDDAPPPRPEFPASTSGNQDNAWADAAQAHADAQPGEPEGPPLPESFDELALPDTLRRAIVRLGWTKPSPVQALAFEPLINGRDVMVQSHTGSGKTGAFCMPWLASRFDPRPASETGVQLLVMLPTRELAKQVCDELRRLALETPVEVLPVYGGTPMNPQLTALRAGVHAVVGTPGRILDHIRRRSLDLSKVRTVVLDECDEMLSMGFLEDIRAILDEVKGEHLTALFSATIPSDIERIAKRYMNNPASVQLSGDQVAAAEIEHAFYSVTSSIKTRDLLDVIMVEDPARAIVFCNTREETKLVASVLRREGFHAEELSSDLNQTQRERVMKLMREHKLRFLVATDVAARGIDISHVSHVINYSFPESAEVYVHRTGRTGRAGRTGIAISLINPREIGNFYYLKLQYSSIVFTERHLPPAAQLATERTEFKLDGISKRFPELVSPEWVLLARSLMGDPRGERVVALLLERAMRAAPRPESVVAELADGEPGEADSAHAPVSGPGETIEREQRDLREHREPREPREGGFGGGSRDRGRGPRRDERGGPRFGDRDRPRRDDDAPGERNFRDRDAAPGDRNVRDRDATGERNFRDRDAAPGERNFRDRDAAPGERNFRDRGDRPESDRNFRDRDATGERNVRDRGDRPEGERNFRTRDAAAGDRNFRGDANVGAASDASIPASPSAELPTGEHLAEVKPERPVRERGDMSGVRGFRDRNRDADAARERPADEERGFRAERDRPPGAPSSEGPDARPDVPRERPADEERGFRAERDRPREGHTDQPQGERGGRHRDRFRDRDRDAPRERPADAERGFQAERDRPPGLPRTAETGTDSRLDTPRERPADEERGFRAERDRPREGHPDQGRGRDRFRDRDGRRRDEGRGPQQPQSQQAQSQQPQSSEPRTDVRNDAPRGDRGDRGDRRRRRDRSAPDANQLPLQATGEPKVATAWIDPPTPVLAEAAPTPDAVLATAVTATLATATAAATSNPPPGQIPLARRGRFGDRGRFVLRSLGDTVAAPLTDASVVSDASGQPVPGDSLVDGGESGDPRRKRRRRRRRGRRGEGEAGEQNLADTGTGESGEGDDDDSEPDGEPTRSAPPTATQSHSFTSPSSSSSATDNDNESGDARRKRRRRRRGGARPPEAGTAPVRAPEPPQPVGTPVVAARRMAQDEIIIDIDESELEAVQSEFGELDDQFDEFALMDRRQAVIETLQEEGEVELEDLSRSDARRTALADSDAEADAGDEGDDEDDSDDEPEAAAAPTVEASTDTSPDSESEDDSKRKRRRRRKKAAPVVMPELTAPPHKDFWEVWAGKFTYQDFEDGKYTPPNNVPEVEDEPPAPVPADRSASRQGAPRSGPPRGPRPGGQRESRGDFGATSARPPLPARTTPTRAPVISAGAELDDSEFTKVCLNLGRSHGHKAATIRALLRDHLGLEGRAIRDLTVRDADTLFRVHLEEVTRIQEALAEVREGEQRLTIEPAGDDRADDLRAPPPDALPESTPSDDRNSNDRSNGDRSDNDRNSDERNGNDRSNDNDRNGNDRERSNDNDRSNRRERNRSNRDHNDAPAQPASDPFIAPGEPTQTASDDHSDRPVTAPGNDEAPAAPTIDAGDAQTIVLDPLEFTDAPRVGATADRVTDDAGNT